MGYLDSAGLSHFTAWVKARLSGKQDALTPDGSIKLQGGDIAVSLPTKAVSKAEYEALTDAEKQAEVLYAVTDDAGGSGGGEVYSTEETRIGTWVDGKTIYKRTIVFKNVSIPSGLGNANPRIVKIPDSDIETLINCVSQFSPSGTNAKFCTIASVIDGQLSFFNNYSTGEFTCSGTFTLKYTKTTN